MATNPRIGIAVNLPDGATYDLLLIDHPDSYPEGQIQFKFDETPRKITGIQKVAQFFLKALLTRKGTDVINEDFGTYFTDYTINANRTTGDRELYVALTSQIRDAESQTKSILNTAGSDDASMLREVGILGIDVAREAAVIYLKIMTEAGISAQVAVPFPELDLKLSEV
jgi:hypothetical protein